ncbi:hypothetical protein FHS87_001050 [Roseomonas pecuniae]|uniref:Uncharacterized protein n=1 Tax=Muricoccus pecuniae TaxID=693023 RepID=A0A840YAH7_9PROT|nr:hypothetical protein [Roseomonas pecuniae]
MIARLRLALRRFIARRAYRPERRYMRGRAAG